MKNTERICRELSWL